jgi:hypothetical protein
MMPMLRASGRWVASSQLPLVSITDDAAEVHRLLARVDGFVILSAHSSRGAVITKVTTGKNRVKALVYVAAMVPGEGETEGTLLHRAPAHALAQQLAPDRNDLIWMSEGACVHFCERRREHRPERRRSIGRPQHHRT